MSSKIHIVVHKSGHHGQHSSYHIITQYLACHAIHGANERLPYRLKKVLTRDIRPMYTTVSVERELSVCLDARPGDVVHYLFTEQDLHYGVYLKRLRGIRLFGSCHYPPSVLETLQMPDFARMDAVICVGRSQVQYIKTHYPEANPVFIPLGIDTDYFVPSPSGRQQNLLFVGSHMRDFDALNDITKHLLNMRPKVKVRCIIRAADAHNINRRSNVEILSGLGDDDLLRLYQTSSAMVLPLTDCTANNAILEAMACGCPIVVSDVGDIGDYTDDSLAIRIQPDDVEAFMHEIFHILDSRELVDAMSTSQRNVSLRYDWQQIAARHLEVYGAS